MKKQVLGADWVLTGYWVYGNPEPARHL